MQQSRRKKCGAAEKMSKSKEARHGGIHPAMFKPLAEVLAKPCIQLFNAPLNKGWLPAKWLTSTVITAHNGGDRYNRISNSNVNLAFIRLDSLKKSFPTG